MTERAIRLMIGRHYALGHDIIDSEHAEVARCWDRAVRCEPIEFPFQIARLRKLMRDHFRHERDLVEATGAAMCGCHIEEHQALLDLCDRVSVLHRRDSRRAQSLLRHTFAKLIRRHVHYTDQMAVLLINAGGAGGSVWRGG